MGRKNNFSFFKTRENSVFTDQNLELLRMDWVLLRHTFVGNGTEGGRQHVGIITLEISNLKNRKYPKIIFFKIIIT